MSAVATLPNVTLSSTTTSLNISWTRQEFSLPILEYTVSLTRVTGASQVLCPSLEERRLISTTETFVSFTNLQEFSTYIVTVNATFNRTAHYGIDGPGSQSIEVTTPSDVPNEPPVNVSLTEGSRNVSVTWDMIECSWRNGPITSYAVDFQEEEGGAQIPGEVRGQTFTAGGLTPNTAYTFRVAGVNINGTGPYTSTLRFNTDEDSK
jgi:hypothetical protein